MDYYGLLDLDKNKISELTDDDIKKAYYLALRKNPPEKNPELFKEIRVAYNTLRDSSKRSAYDKTIAIQNNTKDMRKDVAIKYKSAIDMLQTGSKKQAVKILEELLENSDSSSVVRIKKGLFAAYISINYSNKAAALCEELIKEDSDNEKEFLLNFAQYLASKNKTKQMETYFKRYFTKFGEDPSALVKYAKSCLFTGQHEKMSQILNKLSENKNLSAENLTNIIGMYMSINEPEKIEPFIEPLKMCLEAKPGVQNDDFFKCIIGIFAEIANNKSNSKLKMLVAQIEFLAEYFYKYRNDNEEFISIVSKIFFEDFMDDEKIIDGIKGHIELKLNRMMSHVTLMDDNGYELSLMILYSYFFNNKKTIVDLLTRIKNSYPMIFHIEGKIFSNLLNPEMNQYIRDELQNLYDRAYNDTKSIGGKEMFMKSFVERALFGSSIPTFKRQEPKISRNDQCPCGSGKKYKKCCGK